MFADQDLACKIEEAEARLLHDTVSSLESSLHGWQSFVRKIGGGVASFARRGSPLNKIIGIGISTGIEEANLADIENLYRQQGEPVRIELSTLALADNGRRLTERGYRLLGFENVLGINLQRVLTHECEGLSIERISASRMATWSHTIVTGFSHPDETGVVVDSFTKDIIAQAITDVGRAPEYDRYLASIDGQIAGGASMCLAGEIALLTGATTLAPYRRRGVQGELLRRRLRDAQGSGAKLAVITTAGGTRSQANAIRQGFSLLYARAILVLE